MTTTKQLYSLQELDLAMDIVSSQKAEVERELGAGMALDQMEAALQSERERLQEVDSLHRLQQLEAGSLRDRSAQLEQQLYSGALTNPRDLEPLEQEASNVRQQVEQRDLELLELSVQVEECRDRCAALEKEYADTQAAWERRQGELSEQLRRLVAERESIAGRRAQLAAVLDPSELRRYESLRKTKGGRAVAKVVR
ncbi:MAG: hypothetical protein AAB291_00945, partial [Chloroflexota bacterium]